MDDVVGASVFGSGTITGMQAKAPSERELDIAKFQGSYFAQIVKMFNVGLASSRKE